MRSVRKMDKIPKLYKVLVDGKSCHGGTFEWKTGKWYHYRGELKMCSSGFHLTTKPYMWYKQNCEIYEAKAKNITAWDNDKCVCSDVKLMRKLPYPSWLKEANSFINSIGKIKYFKPDGKPNPEWKLYYAQTRDAARAAAGDAARAAAGDAARAAARAAAWAAAWAAAGDAALYARCLIVKDKLEPRHIDHAEKRMDVWKKGYELLCDIDGVLYVYEVRSK